MTTLSPPRMHRAFTLIELLIALVVLAAVGMTVSSAVGNVSNQSYMLERRAMAHWVAQNQLVRMRLELRKEAAGNPGVNRGVPLGKETERVFMALRDWEVRLETTATDVPTMGRVEVTVYELVEGDREGPLDTIVAFVGQN